MTNGFRKVLSTYSHEFNLLNNRSGALFRPKTKAKSLSDGSGVVNPGNFITDYCSNCFLYIHCNPVKAGLVNNHAEWRWSSYNEYFGISEFNFCNKIITGKYCSFNLKEANLALFDYCKL
ncbi:MAG: hypothetical protein ABJA78_04185 [Ferruginibacter sp.]